MLKLLCLIDTDDRNYYFRHALRRLEQEFPAQVEGQCFSPMAVRMNPMEKERLLQAAQSCDFAFVYFHGGCNNLPDFHKLWQSITSHAPCFFVSSLPEEMGELVPVSGLKAEDYREMNAYFSRISEENTYELLHYAAWNLFGMGRKPKPWTEIPDSGLYVEEKTLSVKEEQAYLQQALETEKPVIGVLIHRSYIQSGNVSAINGMLRQLKQDGAFVLPVFSTLSADSEKEATGVRYSLEPFFRPQGKDILSTIVVTTGFSLTKMGFPKGPEGEFSSSIFEKWGVPVLQAMATRFTAEQYDQRPQGIDAMSLTSNVFQPEMDGQLITVPYALSEQVDCEGIGRKLWQPMEERIRHLSRLALNFAKLSRKKNSEKKIAILFHNMPGNHNIGRGAGLDTFQSVKNVLDRMKAEGYSVDRLYEDGQQLADCLLAGLTNDSQWISGEEAAKRAADRVDQKQMDWYERLSEKNQKNMQEYWGTFPGNVLIEKEQLLIPGIINGNIFIGLQPSRAFDQQAERLYHDAVFPPPYSYIAYYRWIEEQFGADAMIHVGTHGSVEWLPGKEIGLSGNCYPDICMGSLPNYYIYHMGITGEGIQAKRRSAACILDHLPPSMDDAGTYEKLSDVDKALSEYYAAKKTGPAQVPVLQKRLFSLAQEANLTEDLKLSEEQFLSDPEEHIKKLHHWVEELKNSAVTDGLHIYGQVPETNTLYENMLRMLLRVKNGSIPALNDAVLRAMGYDAEQIKDHPDADINGQTASAVYERAVILAKELVHQLAEQKYESAAIDRVVELEELSADRLPLKEVLHYLCEFVKPRLDRTTDEMENLIRGLNGSFVEPGLGGNPTRGNAALLPTGRNFYAGDPSEIPSVGAWEIGQKLAKQSLAHYLQERGEYPESIAMVVWSGNVIKTCGEDFGEIFSLMGVRPVYLGSTSKVIGVEPIPLEELGHPRIDVTLRVSGLFRDMYPNLIQRMDEAVTCVAMLDEKEEDNFIRKHINEDVRALIDDGLPPNEAAEQAQLRVFGCPSGGYGAGVANLISNRNWKDYKDLASVYETWSGNAYGRGYHGAAMQKLFKKRLSTVGMTIKNESTVEVDMLSSDDFFSYHGGLVACVKANSGQTPISLTGHSDDPERPLVRDTAKETARIMRSRVLNPKWLEGLKRHGFKGAQEVSKAMDSFFGWDASAEVAEDWMYEQVAQNFLLDSDTRQWMEQANAAAVYNVAAKLLEASQRGMWKAKANTLDQLQSIFLNTEGLLEEGK